MRKELTETLLAECGGCPSSLVSVAVSGHRSGSSWILAFVETCRVLKELLEFGQHVCQSGGAVSLSDSFG